MSFKRIRVSNDERDKLSAGTIDVVVGEPGQHDPFIVHERLICASSPFFEKAMSDRWQKTSNKQPSKKQRIMELPNDEPETFQLYVYWLYFGTLPVFRDEPSDTYDEYSELFKAYTLGDKLLDGRFQNIVIDAIIEKSVLPGQDGVCWFPGYQIEYVYDNTNESAPIRKLLVDMFAYNARSD